MGIRLGLKAELSFKTTPAGTYRTIRNVKDLTQNFESGEEDATTRANNGWRATVATLKEASLEWEMVWNTNDPAFQAIKDAWLMTQPIYLRALDAPDGEGLEATFNITSFTKAEPIEGVQRVSVTAKVTYDDENPPRWVDASTLSSDSISSGS